MLIDVLTFHIQTDVFIHVFLFNAVALIFHILIFFFLKGFRCLSESMKDLKSRAKRRAHVQLPVQLIYVYRKDE